MSKLLVLIGLVVVVSITARFAMLWLREQRLRRARSAYRDRVLLELQLPGRYEDAGAAMRRFADLLGEFARPSREQMAAGAGTVSLLMTVAREPGMDQPRARFWLEADDDEQLPIIKTRLRSAHGDQLVIVNATSECPLLPLRAAAKYESLLDG